MELVIEYLIQKGGVFGVLLAISFAWIVFREQHISKISSSKKEDKISSPQIEKILYIVEDLKSSQEKALDQVNEIGPEIGQIKTYSKAKSSDINELGKKLTDVDDKIGGLEGKIRELYDWHSVRDSDGIPVWYVKNSLRDSIHKLEESVSSLEENFTKVIETIRLEIEDKLEKVNKERIEELKELLFNYNKTVTDLIIALEKIKIILQSRDGEG